MFYSFFFTVLLGCFNGLAVTPVILARIGPAGWSDERQGAASGQAPQAQAQQGKVRAAKGGAVAATHASGELVAAPAADEEASPS